MNSSNVQEHVGMPQAPANDREETKWCLLIFARDVYHHLRFVHSIVVFLRPKLGFAICLCL
jgi:hypothetical protein